LVYDKYSVLVCHIVIDLKKIFIKRKA
jgi:hypothetical protein